MSNVTIRIQGTRGSGKTALAAVIRRALIAHGVTVEMPAPRVTEIHNTEHDEWSKQLTTLEPRVTILEDLEDDLRIPTLEERMIVVQKKLEERGMRDFKVTLAPETKPRTLYELQEGVVQFMEAYLEGRYSPPTVIEIDPGSEPN
ncbi:hypothetical protein D3C71_77280 [compost metagenome]